MFSVLKDLIGFSINDEATPTPNPPPSSDSNTLPQPPLPNPSNNPPEIWKKEDSEVGGVLKINDLTPNLEMIDTFNQVENKINALVKETIILNGENQLGLIFGDSDKVDPKLFYENFAAGSGLLTKYTIYLSKITQNNKLLSTKANEAGQRLGSLFFELMRYQSELRDVQSSLDSLPEVISQVNELALKVKEVDKKIQVLEEQLGELVNVTVTSQIKKWKEDQELEIYQQLQHDSQQLVDLEKKFSKIAEEERQKAEQASQIEKAKIRKQLTQDIKQKLEDYSTGWGTLSSAPGKARTGSSGLERVTLEEDAYQNEDDFYTQKNSLVHFLEDAPEIEKDDEVIRSNEERAGERTVFEVLDDEM
eukprot:TRINITY_DN4411_c0_g1_i1.p1 TRINITY_DN4411_c0_g1~~TRINITY_DN4411_c0_g1_i1.p1  ORF type:complete len:374 (+),score=136.67 TRINITY_DN4411_c0_g1_i1:34-1122(+)